MIKVKKYTISNPLITYGYETSDGYEFSDIKEAKRHEAAITAPRKIDSKDVFFALEDVHHTLFYLTSIEDIEYLRTIHYEIDWYCDFTEQGWYIGFLTPGGDFNDSITLEYAEDYKTTLRNTLQKLEEETT